MTPEMYVTLGFVLGAAFMAALCAFLARLSEEEVDVQRTQDDSSESETQGRYEKHILRACSEHSAQDGRITYF